MMDGVEGERQGTQGKTIWRNLRLSLLQFADSIAVVYDLLSESVSSCFISFSLIVSLLAEVILKRRSPSSCVLLMSV